MNQATIISSLFLILVIVIFVLNFKLKKARQEIENNKKQHADKIADIINESKRALAESEKILAEDMAASHAENERIRNHYQSEARQTYEELHAELGKMRDQLEHYKHIEGLAHDESTIRATLSDAIRHAEELNAQAQSILSEARALSSSERSMAMQKAKDIKQQADAMLARATTQANLIVGDAHKKAESIAGDAYLALREKEQLSESIKAMRNVIEGYGDRYIIPAKSLLDELAGDFGHLEAGQMLSSARDLTRKMVEQGIAAECDYSERNRRETAIRFVVDAFNGRVDAILSRCKHDNYGTLEQEIRDVFSLVNQNGEAFRNARILSAFLDARLAELKWAVIAQELRLREREEQLRIREQIREEERARREYEKAMRDAQREEDIIKQALEKARAESHAATAEQKTKFEQQIAELAARLSEAEAKNQRALSMAQQTRKGNVYIISNIGSFGEDIFKIGMTRRLDPMDRIYELSDASVPFDFDVHAIIPADDAPALESDLHGVFNDMRINRVNLRKEFFRVPLERIRAFVKERNIEASFTMTAEAHEYRESQVMAKMTPEERERYQMMRGEDLETAAVGKSEELV